MPRGAAETPATTGPSKRLIDHMREATNEYDETTDEALIGAVQNWLESLRLAAYERYRTVGTRLLDDIKRFAEAGL